jgi:hypothetical protein
VVLTYYDRDAATSWISEDASVAIARSLGNLGYRLVGAEGLEQVLKGTIGSGTAERYVVVFTKDVIPITLYNVFTRNATPAPTPTPPPIGPHETLLMRFLQEGGIVIWLGDVPFWYVGRGKEKIEIWQNNYVNFFGALGVVQVFSMPPQQAYSIHNELDLGAWPSARPVLWFGPVLKLSKSGVEECILKQGFVPLAETRVLKAIFIPSSLTIGSKTVKLEDLVLEKCHKAGFKAFSAWIRCIGDGMFIRLWDHVITDKDTEKYALKIPQIIGAILKLRTSAFHNTPHSPS